MASSERGAAPAEVKVPTVTASFWVVKILTTGMGEVTSDYLFQTLRPGIVLGLGFTAFAISLVLQLRARRYVPWIYWFAVVMVAVFGTMAADVVHVGLGVPYAASTLFFMVALAVVLLAWHRSERTLAMHSIVTRRREAFYWATVLATFALGTAAGDLTAKDVHLGYLVSALVFVAVFAVAAVGYWRLGLNAVVAFWWAYVATRPIGASYADLLALPQSRGGLNVGTGTVSIALTALIVVLVAIEAARISPRCPRPGRG